MSYKYLANDYVTGAKRNVILRLTDNMQIPFDETNKDYQEYKEWLAEGNTPEARRALEILKSIDPNQPGHFHMQGGTALDYKANGGYMKAFPN